MKILCVISALTQGGAEKVMVDLTASWAGKHEVHLLTVHPRSIDFFKLSPQVNRYSLDVSSRKIWNLKEQKRIISGIRRKALELQPYLVISFVIKTNVYVQLALNKLSIPTILCEHSIINRNDIPVPVEILRRLLYPCADMIGVLTTDSKRELLRRYKKIKGEKVIVLPNPIESLEKNGDPVNKTLLLNNGWIGKNDFVAVSLGRLVRLKGFHHLADSSLKCLDSIRFLVFGDGDQKDALERGIKENQLDGVVSFPGRTNKIKDVLMGADIFFCLSDYEGFPMGIGEAMSCGLPIVAFNVPGVRDLIKDGETGFLIPHGDMAAFIQAVKRLKENDELRAEMGEKAKRYISQYEPDKIDEIWQKKVFEELVR